MGLLRTSFAILAAGLLALVASACDSTQENGNASVATHSPSSQMAILSISLSPAKTRAFAPPIHPPLGENIAPLASGLAFVRGPEGNLVEDQEAHLAIDDNEETIWSAKQGAPQWYSILLDDLYLVDRVEMVITQSAPGPTTHQIWLGHGSGLRTLHRRLSDVHTQEGQTLSVAIDPPQLLEEVLVVTLHSPSWVAWRELRVYGARPSGAEAVQEASHFELMPVARGLVRPVLVTNAGDGSGRVFVNEQTGKIRIVEDGIVSETPFLDVSNKVACCGERGLIGLAFPPTYANSNHFYVSYTNLEGHTTISRFLTTDDPNQADEGSEEVLLTIDQPHENHNGGHLAFGPRDGYLYIGSGDGGLLRDPDNRGQAPDTLLGKLLRIDVESGARPYGIPDTNPFSLENDYRDEIWALGLRNPWGFAFDKDTGALFIPDTGQDKREEVNFQAAGSRGGQNYGWPIMEGNICFEHVLLPCRADGLIHPIAEYRHTQGCAVVGGTVYRATQNPELSGLFVFADFCTGQIWGLKPLEANTFQQDRPGWHSRLLIEAGVPISSIGEDEDGNVYAAGYADGVIYMLAEK